MRDITKRHKLLARLTVTYMTVAILFAGFPLSTFASSHISADIKANGQDGTVTITNGEAWNYSWTSNGATACQLTSPTGVSGITLAGNDGPIPSDHPWYPAVGSSTTLTLNCTDGTDTTSDSVTIQVVAPTTPPPAATTTPSVVSADIKANGQDGTVTITNGEAWNYSWTSNGATACQLTSPTGVSGITLAGNDGPIPSNHPWYPSVGGSTTLTLNCTDGTSTATDSVIVRVAASTATTTPSAITADIKINGQDGTVTITNGEAWNYSWTSNGATACQLTSPTGVSGITLAGNDGPIPSNHPWYPAVGGSTTLTLNCTDGVNTATDVAIVRIVAPTTGGGGGSVTADIKINGQDGTVTITNGEAWNYSWTSNGATACQLTSPTGVSGITLAGNDGPIPSDHPWYPAVGSSTTLTLNCTDGVRTATDSATVRVVVPTTGGGGGGGGGGGSTGSVSAGPVTGPVVVGNFCPFLTSYMRIDFNNNREQVARLQVFLQLMEGHNYVNVTGVFDEATRQAVSAFQLKYRTDVLTPWGISEPTGYVYITTLNKINEILCGPQPAYTLPQQQEIRDYVHPVSGPVEVGSKSGGSKSGNLGAGTTTPYMPVVGEGSSKGQNITGGSVKGLAAALFSSPNNFAGLMQCVYEFILILIVLYILGSVLENVLYKNVPENSRKRFLAKWTAISIGLVAAIVGAYLLGEWCLLLPLLITLIASAAWTLLYPKHDNLRTSAKTWYVTSTSKAKSVLGDKDESKEVLVTDSGAKK